MVWLQNRFGGLRQDERQNEALLIADLPWDVRRCDASALHPTLQAEIRPILDTLQSIGFQAPLYTRIPDEYQFGLRLDEMAVVYLLHESGYYNAQIVGARSYFAVDPHITLSIRCHFKSGQSIVVTDARKWRLIPAPADRRYIEGPPERLFAECREWSDQLRRKGESIRKMTTEKDLIALTEEERALGIAEGIQAGAYTPASPADIAAARARRMKSNINPTLE